MNTYFNLILSKPNQVWSHFGKEQRGTGGFVAVGVGLNLGPSLHVTLELYLDWMKKRNLVFYNYSL